MTRDIYIKKSPSIAKANIQTFFKEEKCYDNFIDSIFGILEDIFKETSQSIDTLEDWTGCNNFWTLEQEKNKITMIEHSLKGEGIKKEYTNEEMGKEFIKLTDFLSTGKYIGKFFRRTILTREADREYLPVNHDVFVLYENEGVLLVVKKNNDKPIITIIDKRFTLDGNYEFYGVEKNSYDDKKGIKKEIIKQLAKNKGLNM